MRFYDVSVNRSVPTEANRGLTSYSHQPDPIAMALEHLQARAAAGSPDLNGPVV
jgi:hypothetical protein